MPNHLHALIALKNSDQSINTIVSNAKLLWRIKCYFHLAKIK